MAEQAANPKMRERAIPSAMPLYFAGAAFLVGALVLPVYQLPSILICVGLAYAAYGVGKKIVPPRMVLEPVPDTIYSTGEQTLNETLAKAEQDLNRLAQLNASIPDVELSRSIGRMETAGRSILDHVSQNPGKAKNIRKFAGYYLPTSIKLLSTYAELSASGANGTQAQTLMRTIGQNAATVADAFESQLDSLFSDKVLDVSADVTVLEGMMKSDGLTGGDAITAAGRQGATASTVAVDSIAAALSGGVAPVMPQAHTLEETTAGEIPKPKLTL